MTEKVARYLFLVIAKLYADNREEHQQFSDEETSIMASMSTAERSLVTWEGP